VEVVEDVLGELRGGNPNDVNNEEDENPHGQTLRPCARIGGGPSALRQGRHFGFTLSLSLFA